MLTLAVSMANRILKVQLRHDQRFLKLTLELVDGIPYHSLL
jgi:hypothetical protein